MLGGTTYEEGRAVALLNHQLASSSAGGPGGTRILLGGSTIHNSARYLAYIRDPLTYKLPQYGRIRRREFRSIYLWPAYHLHDITSREWTQHQPPSGRVRALGRRRGGIGSVSYGNRGSGRELPDWADAAGRRGIEGWCREVVGECEAESRG